MSKSRFEVDGKTYQLHSSYSKNGWVQMILSSEEGPHKGVPCTAITVPESWFDNPIARIHTSGHIIAALD